MFTKILIANRGEIVSRIVRTLVEMKIEPVLVYHELEKDAPYLRLANEKYSLGSGTLSDTFLNVEKIIEIAVKSKADAIHPGYGFLSENADFALVCRNSNIVFIGPAPSVIRLMGRKSDALQFASTLGIPIIPKIMGTITEIIENSDTEIFPALIKAVSGGGGKGMKMVRDKESLIKNIEQSSREALNYFGDHSVFLEKYLRNSRHIEVQILADNHGNIIHLFERECSIQRRYQKIIEEAPVIDISEKVLQKLRNYAIKIACHSEYSGAGTVEFIVDEEECIYFLEMNTRIQVEHAVTEKVTGIDIVEQQIICASGEQLSIKQEEVNVTGNAIEARIYAEDPLNGFVPSPGIINYLNLPKNSNLRIDHDIKTGLNVLPIFDPMLAKVIAYNTNREMAISDLIHGLKKITLHGVKHNIALLLAILKDEFYHDGQISTNFIDINLGRLTNEMEQLTIPQNKDLYIIAGLIISLQANSFDEKPDLRNYPFYYPGRWRLINQLAINLNEEEYTVRYKRTNNNYLICINDNVYPVLSEKIDENRIQFRVNNIKYEIIFSTLESNLRMQLGSGSINLQFKRGDVLFSDEINKHIQSENKENGGIKAPLNGKIIQINCRPDMLVEVGEKLLVIESMKMENSIYANVAGRIKDIKTNLNQLVQEGDVLLNIEKI